MKLGHRLVAWRGNWGNNLVKQSTLVCLSAILLRSKRYSMTNVHCAVLKNLLPSFLLTFFLLLFSSSQIILANNLDSAELIKKPYTTVETIASFRDIVPRSIAVSADSRIFICCPRGHNIDGYTLVEIKDGKTIPFPDAQSNKINLSNPTHCLFSAMAAVVDDKNIFGSSIMDEKIER